MTGARRSGASWLLGALVVLGFAGLGRVPLTLPDEGRYTLLPLEMVQSGDFVTPRLDGVLYFEKPPLHYWLNAAAIALLGPVPVAARLACAFFGLATVLATGLFARRLGGTAAGLLAAAVLATSPLHFALSRTNTLDMTVTFFVTLTVMAFWEAVRPGARRIWWDVAAVGAALAVLTKGLIGLVIPGAIVFFWLLASGRWEILKRVPWLRSLFLLFVVAAPWHVLMARRHGDFLDFYFVREHFLRYATPIAGRQQPFWYFFAVVAIGMAPWTPLLLAALGRLRSLRDRAFRAERPELLFLAVWAGFVILFFSASKSKLSGYVLPALPPLAILVALRVTSAGRSEVESRRLGGWLRAGAIVLGVLALVLAGAGAGRIPRLPGGDDFHAGTLLLALLALAASVGTLLVGRGPLRRTATALAGAGVLFLAGVTAYAPRAVAERSSTALVPVLRAQLRPGDLLFSRKDALYDLAAELRRPIDVVDYTGELDFGIGHLSAGQRRARFPDLETFRSLWGSERTVWLVVKRSYLAGLQRNGLRLEHPVGPADGPYLLFRNHAADATAGAS